MNDNNENCTGCTGLSWWMTLLIAVLAVPAFGGAVAVIMPVSGMLQIAVFIIACWLCTYLGMRLMSNPKMHKRIGDK